MFEDDGLFTPCHSDMEGTEGVKTKCILDHLDLIPIFWFTF